MNRLAVTADDAADVALTQLHFENCHFARNFCQHHIIREFDELTDDELEKLFHKGKVNHESTRIETNLIFQVSRLEIFGLFPNRTNFFTVGLQQPEPIIAPASEKVAVLLDQEIIAIFA